MPGVVQAMLIGLRRCRLSAMATSPVDSPTATRPETICAVSAPTATSP